MVICETGYQDSPKTPYQSRQLSDSGGVSFRFCFHGLVYFHILGEVIQKKPDVKSLADCGAVQESKAGVNFNYWRGDCLYRCEDLDCGVCNAENSGCTRHTKRGCFHPRPRTYRLPQRVLSPHNDSEPPRATPSRRAYQNPKRLLWAPDIFRQTTPQSTNLSDQTNDAPGQEGKDPIIMAHCDTISRRRVTCQGRREVLCMLGWSKASLFDGVVELVMGLDCC